MIKPVTAFFSTISTSRKFLFLTEGGLFLIVTVPEAEKEKLKTLEKQVKREISQEKINHLNQLEHLLDLAIKENNLSLDFSLALGLISRNQKLYIKTYNQGEIYLRRQRELAKIIGGNQSASGFIEPGDTLILTTSELVAGLGTELDLKKMIGDEEAGRLVELLEERFSHQEGSLAALAVSWPAVERTKETVVETIEEKNIPTPSTGKTKFKLPLVLSEKINLLKSRFSQLNNHAGNIKKKRLTLVAALVILVLLFWTVSSSYQRRKDRLQSEKVEVLRKSVAEKLIKADEEAILNLSTAQDLIAQARSEISQVETGLDKKHMSQVTTIKKSIDDQEAQMLKKEEKNYEEFYDLGVESQKAKGDSMALSEGKIAILDKAENKVYILSLTEKSLKKIENISFKETKLIAYYDDVLFTLTEKGINKFIDNKPKTVIAQDKDWQAIISMVVYNGNIYLLDQGKDEIYKYLTGENGFSEKNSYFKSGQASDLSQANSLMIDSAVYIGNNDFVLKYSSGIREEFKTNYPAKEINTEKIYTDKDTEKVAVWDKKSGSVFILDKKGAYQKEIKSAILKKANDLVVYSDKLLILVNNKINGINID